MLTQASRAPHDDGDDVRAFDVPCAVAALDARDIPPFAALVLHSAAGVPRFAARSAVLPPDPTDFPPFAAAVARFAARVLRFAADEVVRAVFAVRPSLRPSARCARVVRGAAARAPAADAAVTCAACAAHSTVRAVRVAPPPAARAPAASGCHLRCCGCAPRASRFERTWYCMLTQASAAHADASRPRAA